MAIIVYAPSLALKQGIYKNDSVQFFLRKVHLEDVFLSFFMYAVTGINVYISVGVLLSVCTFYTALVNILVFNLFHYKLKSRYFSGWT
jgi:hypothetical protein